MNAARFTWTRKWLTRISSILSPNKLKAHVFKQQWNGCHASACLHWDHQTHQTQTKSRHFWSKTKTNFVLHYKVFIVNMFYVLITYLPDKTGQKGRQSQFRLLFVLFLVHSEGKRHLTYYYYLSHRRGSPPSGERWYRPVPEISVLCSF